MHLQKECRPGAENTEATVNVNLIRESLSNTSESQGTHMLNRPDCELPPLPPVAYVVASLSEYGQHRWWVYLTYDEAVRCAVRAEGRGACATISPCHLRPIGGQA